MGATQYTITTISVACTLIVVTALIIYKFRKKQRLDLYELVGMAFTTSTIPTGFQLLWCAVVKPEEMLSINDIRIQIAIIGFVVLYVAVVSIGNTFNR